MARCAASTAESPAKLISLVMLRPIPAPPPEINKIVEQFSVNLKPFRFSQVEIQPEFPPKNKQLRKREKVLHNNLSNVAADRVSPRTLCNVS